MEKDKGLLPEFEFVDDLEGFVDAVAADDSKDDPSKQVDEPAKAEDVVDDPPAKKVEEEPKVEVGKLLKGEPQLVAAYQYYVDRGIFDAPDKETEITIDLLESNLGEATAKMAEKSLDAFIDPLPAFGQAIIQKALEKKGSLTIEDIQQIIGQQRSSISLDSLEDESSAFSYMVKKYEADGYSNEDAQDMANVLKDKGKIVSTAKSFAEKEKAVEEEKDKKIAEQSKKNRQEQRIKEEQFQSEFAAAIDSTGWRSDKKDQIVEMFVSKNFSNKLSSALYNDPKALVTLIDFMSYYDPEKKVFDMENYKKEAFTPSVTKVAKNMRESLWNQAGTVVVEEDKLNKKYEFTE